MKVIIHSPGEDYSELNYGAMAAQKAMCDFAFYETDLIGYTFGEGWKASVKRNKASISVWVYKDET